MSFKSIGHYQGDGGMSLENRPDQCFNATEEWNWTLPAPTRTNTGEKVPRSVALPGV
jgi:hypothetical protein